MTACSHGWCFQITQLPALRSAKDLDGIWTSVTNDEFYALSVYVSAFTRFNLQGYRQQEEGGAFEACARTLHALENVVDRMNQSTALIHFANVTTKQVTGDFEPNEVEAAWDCIIADVTAMPPTVDLLRVVKREFLSWTTGLTSDDISALIKFAPKPDNRDVELVFSGGGMRAAAFALGVLLYIADVKRDERIRQISSVSGGSITNGFLANMLTSTRSFNEQSAAVFARRLARHGASLEKVGRLSVQMLGVSTLLGLLSCLLVLLAALGAGELFLELAPYFFTLCLIGGFLTYRMFKFVGAAVNGWFAFIVNESKVMPSLKTIDFFSVKRLRSRVLSSEGLKLRALRDIDSPITHVFTSTDLRHGEHFHFSQKWAISNTYGSTDPGDVQIYEAVHASAAFPGALAPVNIALSRLHLPPNLTVGLRHLQLVDGGVRDNLGHIFQTRLLGSDSQRDTLTQYGLTQLSIVADASAPRGVADLSESVLGRIPVLRRLEQLVTFPRVLSIMNQSNSEARSLALSTRFGSDGFVLRIRDSPVELCREMIDDEDITRSLLRGGPGAGRADNPRRLRAEAALRALVRDAGATEAYWNGVRNQNQIIPTTLDGLGANRVAALIRHGYVLTMCYAHIQHEWPLSPVSRWSASRFVNLLREESPSSR